ncbi:NfeD family protein [Microcoleus sp. FACHB-1515]|uniref:NfeD family protein n=1 Tax=Cyanophyceae TaxID=3028117 RepID=UPI001683C02F|nr:NfeD family protein [Microcoleus sp. FACHB-1515]MBD2090424.1 NfeD family protein [Microcoleus sp. FACHB-1515]
MELSPPILWLVAGLLLCLLELIVPTAFVEFVMGISAIAVALLAFVVPQVSIQIVVWLILSVALTFVTRRLIPHGSDAIADSKEATTLTAIAPGAIGRVLYEGNSWQARCGDEDLEILPNQPVYVVGRRGTTLIVMPESIVR